MIKRYCTNCNFTTSDSSVTYCPNCGKPLAERVESAASDLRYCPSCGNANPANVTFCSSCGKPLTSQVQPPAGHCPQNYLVWAILTTVLCCLPAGVVSIVYSTKVEKLWAQGQRQEAMEASQKAKNWAIASAVTGAVVSVLYIIIMIIASL